VHPELEIDLLQVVFDGLDGQPQSTGDLLVGLRVGGQPRDPFFLGGQLG
jgi:hypothetical protein